MRVRFANPSMKFIQELIDKDIRFIYNPSEYEGKYISIGSIFSISHTQYGYVMSIGDPDNDDDYKVISIPCGSFDSFSHVE
jgi:hypothetical protein